MVWTTVFESKFFNLDLPLLRRKPSAFAIQDHPGLWRIHWQLGKTTLISTFYTRIDQACWLWGILTIAIFAIAQYSLLDWRIQAVFGTGLTLVGTIAMLRLSRYCQSIRPLHEVALTWARLMLAGAVMTDLGVGLAWGLLLEHLCVFWLGLNAIGYSITGWKLRSRAFFLIGFVHLVGIVVLPYIRSWQFIFTGIVIGLNAMLIAELQWDSGDVCAVHRAIDEQNEQNSLAELKPANYKTKQKKS
jgi:hypothetical protein